MKNKYFLNYISNLKYCIEELNKRVEDTLKKNR